MIIVEQFCEFSIKSFVVGAHQNLLVEAELMGAIL